MKRLSIFIMLAVLLVLPAQGCAKKRPPSDDKIIAQINNYKLMASDFTDGGRGATLDEMIIKNILVQEAQAQNFDKDRAFMKEIEAYWEQALIKLLIKKKTEEFAAQITAQDSATKRLKVQQALEAWVRDLRRHARVKIYEENLKQIQAR